METIDMLILLLAILFIAFCYKKNKSIKIAKKNFEEIVRQKVNLKSEENMIRKNNSESDELMNIMKTD